MLVGTATAQQNGMLTDSRDGQKYKTVKIGKQTWMAQNLNHQTGNSWCYNGENQYCPKYGRLYDWKTAKTACPKGWHLPTREEWTELVTVVGLGTAGKKLKSTSEWAENGNGTDNYSFSALPGGTRGTDGSFIYVGKYGGWWTASEYGSGNAYFRDMVDDADDVGAGYVGKGGVKSVRCLQD